MQHFGNILFTEAVRKEQEKQGSRESYARMISRPEPEGMSEREAEFIAARDSFYMASVAENGWPYVQHRGGPQGFLKILDADLLGFADYRGNRQYISKGNLEGDDRVALFLMDYPNRARLKMLGRAKMQYADEMPDLADRLTTEGEGRVERFVIIRIEAFDWNCPQFITPRFTEGDLKPAFAQYVEELDALKSENTLLRKQLAELQN